MEQAVLGYFDKPLAREYKEAQAQASIDARAKARADEIKTIIWFFIFVAMFIAYVVLTRT